jgi:hypothetical protein
VKSRSGMPSRPASLCSRQWRSRSAALAHFACQCLPVVFSANLSSRFTPSREAEIDGSYHVISLHIVGSRRSTEKAQCSRGAASAVSGRSSRESPRAVRRTRVRRPRQVFGLPGEAWLDAGPTGHRFPDRVIQCWWCRSFPVTAAGQLRIRLFPTSPDSLLSQLVEG